MSKTITGAAIVTPQAIQLTEAKVDITPAQDLHGYDRPWAAGAGKNKLDLSRVQGSASGITLNADQTITINGGHSSGATVVAGNEHIWTKDLLASYKVYDKTGAEIHPAGIDYIEVNLDGYWRRIDADGTVFYAANGYEPGELEISDIRISFLSTGAEFDNVILKPMVTYLADRGANYEPYANVCPITGRTTITLNDGKTSGGQDATYTASLGRTVYGGTYDFVSGDGTTSWANIASYNGETLPGKWLSSLDKYTENGTPTTGAQVVYDTGASTTFTRSGQTINTLKGVNYFWSNAGVVTVTGDFAYLMREFYNYIYINGVQYIRPTSFQIQREDIYAGEYETCTGKIIGDRIGWRYANMTIHFDTLPNEKLQQLSAINEAVELYFVDDDGEHSEQIIRTGFTNTPTRLTHPDGSVIWQDVNIQVRFINAHND